MTPVPFPWTYSLVTNNGTQCAELTVGGASDCLNSLKTNATAPTNPFNEVFVSDVQYFWSNTSCDSSKYRVPVSKVVPCSGSDPVVSLVTYGL